MKIDGFRISAPNYAISAEDMLSGEGAYRYGGRWNNKGTRIVYLGSSLAQAAMELLVHIGRPGILKSYRRMRVTFDEKHVSHIDIDELPVHWYEASMAPQVQDVGDQWVQDGSSLVLQVPSASVVGEINYLLNPRHPAMATIEVGPILPFVFDARLNA